MADIFPERIERLDRLERTAGVSPLDRHQERDRGSEQRRRQAPPRPEDDLGPDDPNTDPPHTLDRLA
jgi:hypothetical protein